MKQLLFIISIACYSLCAQAQTEDTTLKFTPPTIVKDAKITAPPKPSRPIPPPLVKAPKVSAPPEPTPPPMVKEPTTPPVKEEIKFIPPKIIRDKHLNKKGH